MQDAPETARENRAGPGRRAAMVLGAAALLGAAGWLGRRALAPGDPEAVPIPGLGGFHRAPGRPVTGGAVWTAGLDGAASGAPLDAAGACGALTGALAGAPAGQLPLTVISDPFCPNCRRLAAVLPDVARAEGLAPLWLDWPVLGPGSEAAARATLAAEALGAGPRFRARMLRAAFQPTDAYLAEVARGLGLDPAALAAGMAAPDVTARLALTDRAARALALPGVPALVIGALVVPGAPGARDLRRLIAAARALPHPCA